MEKFSRILIAALVAITTFYFSSMILNVVFLKISESLSINIPTLVSAIIGSLLAAYITYLAVKFILKASMNSSFQYIIKGALLFGAIGFIIGFFGPLIFQPEANLGPLLGIFYTGPIGFLLGAIGGFIYWKLKIQTASKEQS